MWQRVSEFNNTNNEPTTNNVNCFKRPSYEDSASHLSTRLVRRRRLSGLTIFREIPRTHQPLTTHNSFITHSLTHSLTHSPLLSSPLSPSCPPLHLYHATVLRSHEPAVPPLPAPGEPRGRQLGQGQAAAQGGARRVPQE